MKIGIIGLGLIGGSLGQAFLSMTKNEVYGKDINQTTMIRAKLVGAIQEPLTEEKIKEIDLLILSLAPEKAIAEMNKIAPLLKDGAIVMDTSGTKKKIVKAMKNLSQEYPNIEYIGVHPMAGKETSGIENATPSLFKGAYIIFTPVYANMPALILVKSLFMEIGSKGIEIASQEKHDKMIAYTSQLAHIVSSSYVKNPLSSEHVGYSAGSFQDMTRVAKLDPDMWSELFLENAENLVEQIENLELNLSNYKTAILNNDKTLLKELLLDGVEKKQLSEKAYDIKKEDIHASDDKLNLKGEKSLINLCNCNDSDYKLNIKNNDQPVYKCNCDDILANIDHENMLNAKVIIGRNLKGQIGESIKKIVEGNKVLVVSDANVAKIYLNTVLEELESAGINASSFVFESGEKSKNFNTYLEIINAMSKSQLTRNDAIIGLGGGVVSDITGFVAATYKRGIEYITISTSLLGMIDAAIGGKTGIDTKYGKNLCGAFHQPSLVIIDIDMLKTLPKEEYKNGLGEAIKYAILTSGEIFEILSSCTTDMREEELIRLCINYKNHIVSIDEKETGLRTLLNLGHTYGHAIETLSNYETKHGEAVVKGIYLICKTSYKKGKLSQKSFDSIKSLIEKYYFDVSCDYKEGDLLSVISHDKKMATSSAINFVDVLDIGKCEIVNLSKEELATNISLALR